MHSQTRCEAYEDPNGHARTTMGEKRELGDAGCGHCRRSYNIHGNGWESAAKAGRLTVTDMVWARASGHAQGRGWCARGRRADETKTRRGRVVALSFKPPQLLSCQ